MKICKYCNSPMTLTPKMTYICDWCGREENVSEDDDINLNEYLNKKENE